MPTKNYVTNFYGFHPVADCAIASDKLNVFAKEHGFLGLVIVAPEGINGTVSTKEEARIALIKQFLLQEFNLGADKFKDATSAKNLFHKFLVRIRPEIVTLNTPELIPREDDPSLLSPEQWHEWLTQKTRSFNLIDSRNFYETWIGTFKGAQNPEIEQFTEFPDAVENKLQADKETPMLIFCTGGIRCEKAALEMRRRGYREVYQLKGGILKYLEQYPHQEFDGECFVFDNRVAVDQELNASSTYGLCPHCGSPAEYVCECARCGRTRKICRHCRNEPIKGQTCSKDCAHHYRLRPGVKLKRRPHNRA